MVRVKSVPTWSFFNPFKFQCQIGTGKVTYRVKHINISTKFQCQIGTGKVSGDKQSKIDLARFQCQIGTGKVRDENICCCFGKMFQCQIGTGKVVRSTFFVRSKVFCFNAKLVRVKWDDVDRAATTLTKFQCQIGTGKVLHKKPL